MCTLSIGNMAALWYTLPLMKELCTSEKACNTALLASQSCHMHGFDTCLCCLRLELWAIIPPPLSC